jgi:hypothetical protein
LPLCRANDPRSLSHVTGGDALQASDAVPFDEMAKAGFQLSALRSSSAIKITTDPPQRPRAKLSKSSIRGEARAQWKGKPLKGEIDRR